MAEIQPVTNSADLTQRFVYFVQMQMQNVMLCLGLIDHPSAPKGSRICRPPRCSSTSWK